MKMIAIRVSDEDHALFTALAAREEMPLSILARRLLRTCARGHGMIEDKDKPKEQPAKPRVMHAPIPTAPNAWREEILARHTGGEPLIDIAESYGAPLSMVRKQLDAAKIAEREGASLNTEELPEYNPVDHNNPTPEEIKANAERARIQLERMGFSV